MIVLIPSRANIITIHKIGKVEWHWPKVKKILKIGIPTGIEQSMFHIGRLMVQSFIASFETVARAGSLSSFANTPREAISRASITSIGQRLGVRRPDQALHYNKWLLFIT